ncbi:hypothetical protein [Hyphomicrobium sp. D-2]|uniref:hypothetical protein n=1 Tax=Hyphomicrobium sp. D-2 TaxID=3041621 RepID=UPI0024554794|nr:hypothetical protein [Hyphomicrobium sp. D-2]MDH4981360.1 hypothetical protein [Hyphomicrobium sp. D-2]
MRGFGSAVGAMVAAILWAASAGHALADVPNLVGTWSGKNDTIGDVFGLRSRDRTVHITEQTDRRFRGYFTYEDGRKDFFGIIFPDDVTFAWVSRTSKGEVHGRILAPDHIAACYVEGGAEATAGCSDLKRTGEKAQ